jgi:hypothetical protein
MATLKDIFIPRDGEQMSNEASALAQRLTAEMKGMGAVLARPSAYPLSPLVQLNQKVFAQVTAMLQTCADEAPPELEQPDKPHELTHHHFVNNDGKFVKLIHQKQDREDEGAKGVLKAVFSEVRAENERTSELVKFVRQLSTEKQMQLITWWQSEQRMSQLERVEQVRTDKSHAYEVVRQAVGLKTHVPFATGQEGDRAGFEALGRVLKQAMKEGLTELISQSRAVDGVMKGLEKKRQQRHSELMEVLGDAVDNTRTLKQNIDDRIGV